MRVLITGAYGLIGAACLARLRLDGHDLIGAGRSIEEARRRVPFVRWIAADFRELTTPASWHELLSGIDAVVNCVGALQDGARDDLRRVHVDAPIALFTTCERQGVRRVVHISAIGAEPAGPTGFARTKGAAESDLKRRDLDWIILRPGLVLASGVYGGTAMLRGAAGFPGISPVVAAASPVQIVAIEDVTETVAWAVRPGAPARLSLDLAHPQVLTIAGIVAGYRGWLGLKAQPTVALPHWCAVATARLADALSWLGWRSPLRSTALAQLGTGIVGDPARWMEATAIAPKSFEDILDRHPASVQDRWFARLYLLKPIAIAVLALFWIATGIIALGPGWSEAVAVMRGAGAGAGLAGIAVAAGATLDIALGLGVLVRRASRAALSGMLAVSLAYAAAAAVVAPQLFLDPLGPILKVFPIMLTNLFALAILDER
ncbi:MAG TPA: SDR family oxidoreductase [Xanthobacteraceae bacterium]|nr:SDR family oxidoreductase [Xanthobacteraceae bacterium]